jgi:hypothetical protein
MRLHTMNAVALVGSEEILHFVQNDILSDRDCHGLTASQ